MYIEIDEGYFEHPKTLRLCAALKDHHAAIYPIRLWKWACRSARDGKLGVVDAFVVEKVVGYEPMDGKCFTALCQGFLDVVGDQVEIHDWMDYTGGAIKRMEDKAEENRRRREEGKKRYEAEKMANRASDVPESYQNRTGTNLTQTRPDQSSPDQSKEREARARDLCASATSTSTVPHNEPGKPSARHVLTRFAAIRAEICGGNNLFWQPSGAQVAKAAEWLSGMPADAVDDIEPAIMLACRGVHDSAEGWTDGRLRDPAFLLGAVLSRWSSLREQLHGCAPKPSESKKPDGKHRAQQLRVVDV